MHTHPRTAPRRRVGQRPLFAVIKSMVAVTFLGGCRLGPGDHEPDVLASGRDDSGLDDAGNSSDGAVHVRADAGVGDAQRDGG